MEAQEARRYCDIVMKGGITSGVVYPRALTEISKRFDFKCVGGTSAGAIAAAAAAAAQTGRLCGSESGFTLLEGLPNFLQGRNDTGQTNLFSFFQPEPGTRPIFKILASVLGKSSVSSALPSIVYSLISQYWLRAFLGLIPGAWLAWLAWCSNAGMLSHVTFAIGVVTAMVGLVLLPALALLKAVRTKIQANFYGLCSGMPSDGSKAKPTVAGGSSLTMWLTAYINKLASRVEDGPPLTFNDLWRAGGGSEESPGVRLEMLTTCVTWQRPFRLPFQQNSDVKENRFYFRKDQFERLFPDNVMKWLVEHPRQSRLNEKWWVQGYMPLPEPGDLPVVIATRMSLSFPILLSAIPLYAYSQDATDEHRAAHPPQRCWFSDGGICSNFPMHLFDSPLPRWPTFAINLVPAPDGATQASLAQPWMPGDNSQGIQESWSNFDTRSGLGSLAGFLFGIVNTMQNWSDTLLARLPGYRDRIAHIGLTSVEGGLNLNMPKARIQTLSDRGAAAGQEFVRRFEINSTSAMNWANHRWLRMRATLASLGQMLRAFDKGCAQPQSGDIGYEDWVAQTPIDGAPSYQWKNDPQRTRALRTIRVLRAIDRYWERATTPPSTGASISRGSPRPRPELRPRARI